MSPNEIAEAEGLGDLAENVDRLLILQCVVERHDKDLHNAMSSS